MNHFPSGITFWNKTLDLSTPRIMGILNVTPDSFSDGGEFNEKETALGRIALMVSQGAQIIDVGGESTRPGSDPVDGEEELRRVIPILKEAIPKFSNTFFSIDTTKYRVAEEALKAGVHFINDISGMQQEPRMAELCVKYNASYILMHSQGNPKSMQQDPTYENVVEDVKLFFESQIQKAESVGLKRIVIDPGIGFGKTLEHNISLLKNLDVFFQLGYPLLIGVSRKSMIGKLLNDRPVNDRLIGTIAIHYHAMMKGANIVRVHDVKEANDSILVYNALAGKQK